MISAGKHQMVWLEFGFLALLIMGPLLLPGYVQTLDMTWGPHIAAPDFSSNTWLFSLVIKSLAAVISSQGAQKLLLLSIFMLSGVGAYRLAAGHLAQGRAGAYLAGLVYVFNPFVYTRFVEGQYLVLLGYALLPWAAASIWRLVTAPDWRHAWRAAAWFLAVVAVSLHTIGFVLLLGFVMAAVGWRHSRRLWTWLGVGAALGLVLAAVWLGPLVLGHSAAARAINSFDPGQYAAFATRSDVGSVTLTAGLLEGFWNDHSGTYVVPSSLGSWWLVGAGLLGAVIFVGVISVARRRDRLGLALIISGLVAWWLAIGVAWGVSAPTTHWLVAHLPFYRGYREPGKWLAVVALGHAYLAARGVGQLEAWTRERAWLRQGITGVALLLPLALVPMLLWGAGGQLRSADYPADWYTLNRTLNADPGQFKVLMLPWHLYLPVKFVGRPVANPAGSFFDHPVITSNDPELTGVAADRTQPGSAQIVAWLRGNKTSRATLEPLGVRYVVLMKEADWQGYDWLARDHGLVLVSDTLTLRVYRLSGAAPEPLPAK